MIGIFEGLLLRWLIFGLVGFLLLVLAVVGLVFFFLLLISRVIVCILGDRWLSLLSWFNLLLFIHLWCLEFSDFLSLFYLLRFLLCILPKFSRLRVIFIVLPPLLEGLVFSRSLIEVLLGPLLEPRFSSLGSRVHTRLNLRLHFRLHSRLGSRLKLRLDFSFNFWLLGDSSLDGLDIVNEWHNGL